MGSKCQESVASLWSGTSLGLSSRRESTAVSITARGGQVIPHSVAAAARKPMSNGALCATMTPPLAKSRNAGSTSAIPGASLTMASRSEEHTSELQSQSNIVCRLLLEKKKKKKKNHKHLKKIKKKKIK